MLTYIYNLVRAAIRSVYLLFRELIYGARCETKGCGCDYYSDYETFDALSRQSHDIFYAQRMVDSGIIGTPLKCDRCRCLRECHEHLTPRKLEPQYMPNGGQIAILLAQKVRTQRINKRFANITDTTTNNNSKTIPKLTWTDIHTTDTTDTAVVQLDSHVTVSYFASFASDDKEFEKNDNFSFKIGKGDAMRGFDAGIRGMKVNGIRKIVIPPHLAYGDKQAIDGRTGETLVFTVKVIACHA